MHIAVIDHGLSNIYSVCNMLKYINCYPHIVKSPKELKNADKIIFPGVGSAGAVWNHLEKTGLADSLRESVEIKNTPFLGICVGMQLMMESSEEGNALGFGWIKGKNVRFQSSESNKIKIPHMAWNTINPSPDKRLFKYVNTSQKFYFIHSFYAQCKNKQDIAATCYYGTEFVAAIESNNMFGVQFHPEKSHDYGINLFKNFINI